MKLIKYILVSALLATGNIKAQDEDAKMIPPVGRSAIGALGAMGAYNAHVALGRIAQADVSTPDLLKRAAQDAGGIMGGTGMVIKKYDEVIPLVPADDKAGITMLKELNELVSAQAKALIDLLKAKNTKRGLEDAQKNFTEARAKTAKRIAKELGFDEELVK